MISRHFSSTLRALFLGGAFFTANAQAADLDKNAKKWLDDVRPLILPEEEKQYRALKNGAEVAEFQKIFWARRDPNLETPENEFQAEYTQLKTDVDTKFKAGRPGSQTDCGRIFILLGAPDDVKKEPTDGAVFRAPETWTYKNRANMTFTGGSMQVSLDAQCQLPSGNKFNQQLDRIAEGRILQANLSYKRDAKGDLVKLADQLPKPTAVQALLKTPRQDFALAGQSLMEVRSLDGASVFIAGLVRGDASGVTVTDGGARKTAKLVIAAHSIDKEGHVQKSQDRDVLADVTADGFVASFSMAVRAGEHTFKVGVVDPKSNKGSVVEIPVKTQEYGGDLAVSPVMVLADIQDGATRLPDEAFVDFVLGATRFVPRYNNVFKQAEAVNLLCAFYGAGKDEAGKISVTGGFEVLKDGKTIARAPEQTFDIDPSTPSAGPVPLGNYPPGKYVARVKLKDNVTKKDYSREATFEIVP